MIYIFILLMIIMIYICIFLIYIKSDKKYKYKYDIFVITLKRSLNRHELMEKNMRYMFNFYYGVDGKLLDDETINNHAILGKISKGQIGCFLSHYNIWKMLKDKQEPTLILEDDSIIIEDLENIEIPNDFDILFFGHCYSKYGDQVNKRVHKVKYSLGMHGYLISKNGIEKLLNFFENRKIDLDFDYIITKNLIETNILNAYMVNPSIIIQSNQTPSIIDRFYASHEQKFYKKN